MAKVVRPLLNVMSVETTWVIPDPGNILFATSYPFSKSALSSLRLDNPTYQARSKVQLCCRLAWPSRLVNPGATLDNKSTEISLL